MPIGNSHMFISSTNGIASTYFGSKYYSFTMIVISLVYLDRWFQKYRCVITDVLRKQLLVDFFEVLCNGSSNL